MPCLLKRPSGRSPGLVTLTHNEVLHGAVAKSRAVRECLAKAVAAGRWRFGVHVQGDCSHLERWPIESWQSFIMWTDPTSAFLQNVPAAQLVNLNCVNFLPDAVGPALTVDRRWDVCVVSRASTIKRIAETLQLIRLVLNRCPRLRVNFIVPDPRVLRQGTNTYDHNFIDRRYFELPLSLFGASELRQMSFISASAESFGNFPVAHDVVQTLLQQSRFMLLASHSEGTPRVVGESLLVGTPCVVSRRLRSGLQPYLAKQPGVMLDDDDLEVAADQLVQALADRHAMTVDIDAARDAFSDDVNRPRLIAQLSSVMAREGHPVEGEWTLDDLHLRLCGHGRKHNAQFLDDGDLFVRWLDGLDTADPYDEDRIGHLMGDSGRPINHPPSRAQRLWRSLTSAES